MKKIISTVFKKKLKNSFSLIEVLVFISILSIFFVIAIAVTVVSLRNMKFNEHKILATKYSEELSEWLRFKKDSDWIGFVNYASAGGTTYCFNSSPITAWPGTGSCVSNGLSPQIYKREVVLTNNGINPVTTVEISVTVSWNELGTTHAVPIKTVFSLFEQ